MRSRLALQLALSVAAAAARSDLLVAYVDHEATPPKQQHIRAQWAMMQTRYEKWSLRCLLVAGAAPAAALAHTDAGADACSSLELPVPSDDLIKGHIVHALFRWLGSPGSSRLHFDFLLKADLSTLVCFSMVTDLIDSAILRHRGDAERQRGAIRSQHPGLARRGDELEDRVFVDDVLGRKDALCYPPYMQGMGYVLSAPLVREMSAMAQTQTLQIYANDDVMVGLWLLGHRVDRSRLLAKEYLDMWYQTSLSQCFPFYLNAKVPTYEHHECAHFHAATGLCWQPRAASAVHSTATSAASSHLQPLAPPTSAAAATSPTGTTAGTAAPPSLESGLAVAISARADEPSASEQQLARLRAQVSVGIKVVTKLRNHAPFILHTIHRRYPGVRLIVADDEYVGVGGEEWRRMHELMGSLNVTYVQLVPRSGLSGGRNALVEACVTPYIVILDDDVFFSATTRLELLLEQLETHPEVHVAAGAYMQYSSTHASPYVHDYSLLFAKSTTEEHAWYAYTPTPPPAGQCYPVHAAHNFFMARTATLRKYPWHPKMAIFEHEHFFFQLFQANQAVVACPHVSIFHYRAPNLHDERYMSNSLRFKEAAFARHFCLAFPTVRKLYAPFWTYDCVAYQLCPRFKHGGQCRLMADPYQITRGAVGLGKLGGAPTSFASAEAAQAAAAAQKADATAGGSAASLLTPSSGAQPVLILGEGAAVDVLAKLFVESRRHMLWREPRTWKAISHMSDDMYARMLSALYRCDLSAQQLLILHSEAPDYDPQAEAKGSGFLSGAPPVTLAEKEHAEWLSTLYAERRRWRPGDHRFCAPGVATAALVSRFTQGVPPELAALPLKVLVMARHPSDVVIERLQAKPVKGMAPYPECTLTTIGACADELCGSMMRLLDDLKAARQEERLKVLKWENLARRRTRMTAELQAWLGADGANESAALAAKMADGVEAQQKAFNSLAKAYPISLQSLRLVEARCAPLMTRLGFKATADVADASSGSTQKRRHAKRSSKRSKASSKAEAEGAASSSEGGAVAAAPPEPLLLLRRTKSPQLQWCPLRLTGTEALAKLFVSLDVPRATRAPPCFPGAKDDVCPVPRSAAWMPARWGAYPFEVVEAASGQGASVGGRVSLEGVLSFAIVRNPWDRLASAYSKLIAVEDQRTAVHRAWIREMHGLGDKEPIGFSHFVRWVVAQEPASMHRAWRPLSRTCHFERVTYSAILRFETLREDVERLMRKAGMTSERERRLWQRADAETRPMVPHSHPDYLLKLHHLYYSDDARNLVEIVRAKYADDIRTFGYEFPTNATIAPWTKHLKGGAPASRRA